MNDLTCRLYLDGPSSLDELTERLLVITDGTRVGRTISSPQVEFDLELSDSADSKAAAALDGFLYWPFGAFVEPASASRGEAAYLDTLTNIISKLREEGFRVVASCGFEDEIAERTGWNWSEATPHHPE